MNNLVAIIPARAGSKRIPNKNIKHFLGQPIIHYVIDVLKQTKLFAKIIISTDDPWFHEIAFREDPQITIYWRKASLCGDTTEIEEVVDDLLPILREYKYTLLAYPTSVFTTKEDLLNSYQMMCNHISDIQIASVIATHHIIDRALQVNVDYGLQWYFGSSIDKNQNSQNYDPAYFDAAQFYWLRMYQFAKLWKQGLRILEQHLLPWVLPSYKVIDINNPEDWSRAEEMYKRYYL